VYCCFNNAYKISPDTFDSWMRILTQVSGSVLWLLDDSATAANNLRREAEARGVNAARLIFAPRLPLPEHLARHRAADLFIDTVPCNAHTTASDALWAGLPVLTLAGESFAARVGASLLGAAGMPELITSSREQYEAVAIELAVNPIRLTELKQKLRRNRSEAPLFDTDLFTRKIENAYAQMYERYQRDLNPDDIHVAP
jgi:predicted O-linked N-acetylglucosamine transferase (SPINDLY family)